MVLYLIILLILSVAGMAALLGAKHYELATGNLIFADSRPKIAKFSARMVFLFGTAVPLYLRWQAGRAYAAVHAWTHKTAAHAVLKSKEYVITVGLGLGKAAAQFLTCDLTHEYISINAEYST